MKKVLAILCALTVLVLGLNLTGLLRGWGWPSLLAPAATTTPAAQTNYSYQLEGGVRYRIKAEGNNLFKYEKGAWSKLFIKGVNLGATRPGLFPGELAISYEEYYRWFTLIGHMNANCVRVYTLMRPQFYNALLAYNRQAEHPLYLFQGVWINEEDITSLADAYAQNGKILNTFIADCITTADALHGNASLPEKPGYASGLYAADVTPYLAGWILGVEWDPDFVLTTNSQNPQNASYDGEYLFTQSASPFEAFLARTGDALIRHQTQTYGLQVPVSFTNWFTTDPLTHPNEPHYDEDKISVNVENIRPRSNFMPKMFACYHAYPYYPESINYQTDYLAYTDPSGKQNPYRAYLRELKLSHGMPVLVGEFGVPASRGMGHKSAMGYNQGGVDETEQGGMLLSMMKSIYEENLAGGLLFTWQDEWFKRTWNNEHFDIPDTRPLWSNAQTNEQFFGLLAFDPGETAACVLDGDPSEWTGDPTVISNAGQLYMKADERYLYIMVKTEPGFSFDTDTLYIPLDTIPGQGNFSYPDTNLTFDKAADFVIQIKGKTNTRLLVDTYYDAFYYLYGEQYKMLPALPDVRTRNSGRFVHSYMCYGYEMVIPPTGTTVPFAYYETGLLRYGNGNPSSKQYSSLSDFIFDNGVLEMRIPWQLLNVMDPAGRQIMGDFYQLQAIAPQQAGSFAVGLGNSTITMAGVFAWQGWSSPTWRERLKPAYYVLQEGLKKLT